VVETDKKAPGFSKSRYTSTSYGGGIRQISSALMM